MSDSVRCKTELKKQNFAEGLQAASGGGYAAGPESHLPVAWRSWRLAG